MLVYLFPSRRRSSSSFRFPLPAPQNLSFSNRLSKTDEAYPFLAQWRHFSPRSKEARRHGHSSFQSLIKQNDPSKNNMANFRLRNSHQTNQCHMKKTQVFFYWSSPLKVSAGEECRKNYFQHRRCSSSRNSLRGIHHPVHILSAYGATCSFDGIFIWVWKSMQRPNER